MLTNYTEPAFFALKVAAVNALISERGDHFHFIGFFTNFTPHHQIGTANYAAIANDVAGIGTSPNWNHALFGLASDRIEGFATFYNINNYAAGAGNPTADFTRYFLAHEFEHRFAVFLPDFLDGRSLQSSGCQGVAPSHWSPQVDGQGGALYLREWIGSNPAVSGGDCWGGFTACRNSDIPGGHYSYTDLYLMGYVAADEMDAGSSELRFMDFGCGGATPYYGPISTFSAADIVAAAGPRIPTPLSSRKHYRAAWIMIYQPGDPPSSSNLDLAAGMLEQMRSDWSLGTLGRGTISHSLSTDCNCNGVADEEDISKGTSGDCNADGVPDDCGRDCDANGRQDVCEIAEGLRSDCNLNGLPDDCEIASGEDVLVEADFNGGLPVGWAANGVFHVSSACDEDVPGCHGGSWAYAGRDSQCSLSTGDAGELVLPKVAIPENGATLRYCFRLDSALDQTFAEVRVNGEAIQRETGGSATWETRVMDLSGFAGRTISLSFNLFTGVADLSKTGWQIDNVRILTGQTDCNANSVPDECDLGAGSSFDDNRDGVPDECQVLVPAMNRRGTFFACAIVAGAGGLVLWNRRRASGGSQHGAAP